MHEKATTTGPVKGDAKGGKMDKSSEEKEKEKGSGKGKGSGGGSGKNVITRTCFVQRPAEYCRLKKKKEKISVTHLINGSHNEENSKCPASLTWAALIVSLFPCEIPTSSPPQQQELFSQFLDLRSAAVKKADHSPH